MHLHFLGQLVHIVVFAEALQALDIDGVHHLIWRAAPVIVGFSIVSSFAAEEAA